MERIRARARRRNKEGYKQGWEKEYGGRKKRTRPTKEKEKGLKT